MVKRSGDVAASPAGQLIFDNPFNQRQPIQNYPVFAAQNPEIIRSRTDTFFSLPFQLDSRLPLIVDRLPSARQSRRRRISRRCRPR